MKHTHTFTHSHIHTLSVLALASLLLFSGCYSVTHVNSGTTSSTGGMFYALPLTRICVDVTYRYYDLTGAVYADYAAEMLALDNFDVEKPYRIQNIEASYEVSADPDHYYLVNPRGIAVQIDNRHLLRSVGLTPQETAVEIGPAQSASQVDTMSAKLVLHNATADQLLPRYNLYDRTDTFYVRGDQPGHPSMTSTRRAPRSLRQRAQAAAEEIAELEDRRADIVVSDRYTLEGKAQMLKQIEEKEAILMAQFVGKPIVETVHFYLTPAEAARNVDTLQRTVLFYFSRSEGICDSDDVGAMPVVCTLRPDQSLQKVRRFCRKRDRETRLNSSFKYRLPSQAVLTLGCELFDFRTTLPVAQFGPVIDLPRRHFKALFDPSTGALIYYQN
ncbi:MAG: DUF4831 family protein [Bacteroidales bacterium]|nr:DUF4831 family protein [Bacteroidales bacterium]